MTINYFALVGNKDSLNKLKSLEIPIGIFEKLENLQRTVDQTPGAVIIIDSFYKEDIYSLCQTFSINFPNISIVLLENQHPVDLKRALKSGASDVILENLAPDQIVSDLKAIETRLTRKLRKDREAEAVLQPIKRNGKIVTVCSTKGGIGKTTFAVNYAVASSKKNQKVVIVDLNLQFGDIALFLDRKPKKTIYDWVKETQDTASVFIDGFLTSYDGKVFFLAAPQRPEFAEVITGSHIRALIKKLKDSFDVIIFDTSSYMEETGLTALEYSDEIFMLTYLDLPTLKNGKLLLETLESLSLAHKVKVILNKESKVKGLDASIANQVLGRPIYARIANAEKAVVLSINTGKPLALSHPRSKISRAIFSIAKGEGKRSENKISKAKQVLTVEGNA